MSQPPDDFMTADLAWISEWLLRPAVGAVRARPPGPSERARAVRWSHPRDADVPGRKTGESDEWARGAGSSRRWIQS